MAKKKTLNVKGLKENESVATLQPRTGYNIRSD